jgi:hypothetical protein
MLGMYNMETNCFPLRFPKIVCFQLVERKCRPTNLRETIVHSRRIGSTFGSQVNDFFDAGFLDRFEDAVEVQADLFDAVAVVGEGEAAVELYESL